MKYVLSLLTTIMFLTSCSKSPQAINFGHDNCTHCGMTITDAKWGAEFVTEKGKCYKFDSIECLLAYYLSQMQKSGIKVSSFWTIDYLQPGELIDARSCVYLKSEGFHSPMGFNAAAFAFPYKAKDFKKSDNDELLRWESLKERIKKDWIN